MEKIVGKVIGNTTSTPMAVPDWLQTDENKADFIKNKPDIDGTLKTVRDDITNLQASLNTKASADTVDAMAHEVNEISEEVSKISSDVLGLSNEVRKVVSESSGKELMANKSTTITASDIAYPTTKAVKDYVDVITDDLKGRLLEKESMLNKVTDINYNINNSSYPTTKAVKDYVDGEVSKHSNNTSKHVTNEERENWNNKYSRGYIDEELACKEDSKNKTTVIDGSANDTKYPTAKAVKDYSEKNFSNALKGSASGNPITITDISPIEHLMKTKIYTKNLFNYKAFVDYCNGNGGSGATENDVYLGEECFSYKVSPRDGSLRFIMDGIQENTQYTLTMEYAISEHQGNESYAMGVLYIYYTDGTHENIYPTAYTTKFIKHTHTTQAGKTVLGFRIPGFDKNATVYVKKNMQFEYGVASTEPVPHVEGVAVTRAGKNLAPITRTLLFSADSANPLDNGYSVNCDIPAPFNFSFDIDVDEPYVSGGGTLMMLTYDDGEQKPYTGGGWELNTVGTFKKQAYVDNGKTVKKISFPNWCKVTGKIRNLQFESGDKRTDYEPYVEPITKVADAEGNVEGITSAYPTTVLWCDISAATISTEYNRDINKVIANLENAILTLGGS